MTSSLRRAALLLFGVVAVGVVVWNLTPAPADDPSPSSLDAPSAYASGPSWPPSLPSGGRTSASNGTRDYAIALEELQGFPPDLPPGSVVELWVGWDRPSGAAPKLQRLIPRAELVRVVPPVTPGGPTAVVVRVPLNRMPDLLWADGYGSLSVAVLS